MTTTFHAGELSVQRHAGLEHEAARLAGMLAPTDLSRGAAGFLAQRQFAAVTARATDGRLWTAPLLGPAGFLAADGPALTVYALPNEPLRGFPAGQPAGLLAVEFATRRRFRVNGTIAYVGDRGFLLDVEQAYGNCPAYLQQRHLDITPGAAAVTVERAGALSTEHRQLIGAADTFLLGTTHPTHGADTSHKGGEPGFVRLEGDELWWPDYAGNNLFNSLGNIAADPATALLFLDFATGTALHLSGTATVEWTEPGDGDTETGRRVRFRPEQVVTVAGLPLHATGVVPSPHNPPVH